MVEEMRSGWRVLDDLARAEADRRVLRAIFFGSVGLSALRALFRLAPSTAARLMSSASPVVLRFLVGVIEEAAPKHNVVRSCEFRRWGGEDLCEHVCRRPTEAFTRAHGIDVRLTPRADSLACDWAWGGREEHR